VYTFARARVHVTYCVANAMVSLDTLPEMLSSC
jgi:hypothetical protein